MGKISLFRPRVSPAAVAGVAETLQSGWLGQGAKVAALEVALTRYLGSRHCVAVSSCTAALHLALHVLDLPDGAEIVTTPLTFVATHAAILQARCRPVLADIQPGTGNIDPASLQARITGQTRAIVVVHYAGYPCDLDEIHQIAAHAGLPVVEDCAHALGATYHQRAIGNSETLQCFSFGPTKSLTMGQGGAVVTNAEQHIARLRRLRSLGIDRDTWQRVQAGADGPPSWRYDVDELGFRYHLSDLNAAIGLAQLPQVAADNARRAAIAAAYRAGLTGLAGVELLSYRNDRRSSSYMFPILAERRDDLQRQLAGHGIETGVHYAPHGLLPASDYAALPQMERFWRRTLTLPLHPGLTDEQVATVVATVREGW